MIGKFWDVCAEAFLGRRLIFIGRRHFAGGKLVVNPHPGRKGAAIGQVELQLLQIHAALGEYEHVVGTAVDADGEREELIRPDGGQAGVGQGSLAGGGGIGKGPRGDEHEGIAAATATA